MKAALILIMALASANAVDLSKVNWAEASKNFQEIKAVVVDTLTFIVEEATRGNAEIGAQLRTYVTSHRTKYMEKVEANNFKGKLADHTLTNDEVKEHFTQLKAGMAELRTGIADAVARLPAANAANIKSRVETATTQVHEVGQKIKALFVAAAK